jgi:hypothetical protein
VRHELLIEINLSSHDTNIILAQLVLRSTLAPFAATKVDNFFGRDDAIAQLERIAGKETGGTRSCSSLHILIGHRKSGDLMSFCQYQGCLEQEK